MKIHIGNYTNGSKPRKINVKIDPWDTHSMDDTLAHVIHPMLVQLAEYCGRHGGCAMVDDEDVPIHLREEGEDWNAELWVTWNPARKGSATDKRFRNTNDPRIKVVELNWRDNPKFPSKLERDRIRDFTERPDSYNHIWEGDYVTVIEGAYYAKSINEAKANKRIGRVAADPLMTIRLFADIGGTGARADAFTLWAAQFIGKEIRVINY
jgi:hypothetical protein